MPDTTAQFQGPSGVHVSMDQGCFGRKGGPAQEQAGGSDVMLLLESIFRKHNIPFHCFADDIQIYFPIRFDAYIPLTLLFDCL